MSQEEQEIIKRIENEYESMLEVLSNFGNDKVEDCLQEAFNAGNGDIRVTIGDIDINGSPKETVLTDPDDLCGQERLDYILHLNKQDTSSIKIDALKSRVEPFFTEKLPFTQLSDHYGVSTIINY